MIRAAFLTALFMCESAFDVSKSNIKSYSPHIEQPHTYLSEDQILINKLLAYAATLAYVKQITEQSRRLRVTLFDERKKKEGSRRNGKEEAKKKW